MTYRDCGSAMLKHILFYSQAAVPGLRKQQNLKLHKGLLQQQLQKQEQHQQLQQHQHHQLQMTVSLSKFDLHSDHML